MVQSTPTPPPSKFVQMRAEMQALLEEADEALQLLRCPASLSVSLSCADISGANLVSPAPQPTPESQDFGHFAT